MNFQIKSVYFDVALSALGTTSYLRRWGQGAGIVESLFDGLQYFCVASCFDRAMRSMLTTGGGR